MFERSGLGAGGGSEGASAATPGTVAGDLAKRVGDFVVARGTRRAGGEGGPTGLIGGASKLLVELAKANGKIKDASIRQDLMRLHTLNEVGRFMSLRQKAAKASGKDIPGLPNIAKLSMSEIMRQSRDVGLRIVGPYGTLHAYNGGGPQGARRGHRQPVPRDGHRAWRCSPRPRRSTAAPTRCSATSSASASSASPRSRRTKARRR